MTHEEWLAARRLGVSGTDVSVLLGVNPYKKEDDLILDKLGVGKPFVGNAATRVGLKLEKFVADAWADREKKILIGGSFLVSKENPRFIGTPDFLFDGGVLEIKTGAETSYKNGMPPLYEAQVRWYQLLTDSDTGHLVACIVPKDRSQVPMHETDENLLEYVKSRPHREYYIGRDQDWEDRAREVALKFLARMDALREPRKEWLA